MSSEEAWLLQLIFPIQEQLVLTAFNPGDCDGYTLRTRCLSVRLAFLTAIT